ncbi:4-hydroxybenzoate geranyltransferase 2-like isoform X1 [Herrania umbratica]|uniref:4-hydroxybenzoate polyprenyltransferase, mitochondrial n=1 Tax=Herrania umbratica TaxID=108875 RepID=A0A6J1AP22_9ROSI|nr:4-hydroxybenzoate geranyltransferase 2-like isoform X1 [Herrania umbratica]
MASLSLAHASRRLLTPSHSFSQLRTRIIKNPAFDSQFMSRSFSRKNSVLLSSNFKTGIACMSTTTSPGGKDDQKLSGENEKVGGVLSWIDYLPREIQPYAKLARVEKPIGTWLLIWPFLWSATLAAPPGSLPDFKTLALFACAAPLLRGAACTINDILDRDIDRMVERTKLRPIASGAVSPLQGLCFLAFQLILSHGILLQLTNYSPIYEASYIFLMSTYPLMKRLTYWAQAYLGLTFNLGALFGWHAIKASLQPSIVLPLYMSGIFWTLVYDTIYAHQDKEDDIKVGVKSTALKFGDSSKEWTTAFAIACISSLALSGYNAGIGWPYYVFLAAASGQLAWQIGTVNLSSPADCSRKFVSNKWFGALIFSGALLGRFFP